MGLGGGNNPVCLRTNKAPSYWSSQGMQQLIHISFISVTLPINWIFIFLQNWYFNFNMYSNFKHLYLFKIVHYFHFSRISEHVLLSTQHNTPVQELYDRVIKYCGANTKFTAQTVSCYLPVLFPNIVKLKYKCEKNSKKVSFRMEIIDRINSDTLNFSDIQHHVPNDWFIISKTSTSILLGHYL